MWIRCVGLWLTVSFFWVSKANGQQYTRGGRLKPTATQSETNENLGIEKLKTLASSVDTRSEHKNDPIALTNYGKNMNQNYNDEVDPSTKSTQLDKLLSSPADHQALIFTDGASPSRDLQHTTHIQRKKCDGIRKIVQCKSDISEETCKQDLVDNGVDIVAYMKGTMFFAICIQTLEEFDLVSKLTIMESLEDDPPRSPTYIPGSGVVRTLQVGEQVVPYGVEAVKAPEFWATYGTRGAGVKVCVIDTGLRASHEDLVGADIAASEGFFSPWNEDGYSHGTHVTGTIAARDNGVGVIGVAPDVSIHVVRVYDDEGVLAVSDLVDAMLACYDAGVDIINMSLGGPIANSAERYVARYLGNLEILLIASSGNKGDEENYIQYPAGYEDVLSVGAVDDILRVADFSTFNEFVDVVAPGVEVLSLNSDSDTTYISYNGTSMAAPHASAVAALLWSQFPDLGVDTLRAALKESAKDIGACGYDPLYGNGMIDVMAAAAFLKNVSVVAPELESCIDVEITLSTDDWGSETRFVITRKGREKKIYYKGGPFSDGQPTIYEYSIPLQDGCYDLILKDSVGDGITNALGQPVITIVYDGEELVNDSDFPEFEKTYTFGRCNRRS